MAGGDKQPLYPGIGSSGGSRLASDDTIPARGTGMSSEVAELEDHDEFYVKTGSPEDRANFFSRLGFFYMDPLLWRARKKTLTPEDMWDLSEEDEAAKIYRHFSKCLEATKTDEQPHGSVARACWDAFFFPRFFISGILQLFYILAQITGPLILQALLYNLENFGSITEAFWLSTALFVAGAAETIFQNMNLQLAFRVGTHVKVATMQMCYDKLCRLSQTSRSKVGAGSVANMQSNDTMKLYILPRYVNLLWSSPLQITVIMGLLIGSLGWIPAIGGVVMIVSLIWFNSGITKDFRAAARKAAGLTDKRVKVANEIVGGIKAIKLYAWEEPYKERMNNLRSAELQELSKVTLLRGFLMMNSSVAAVLIPIITFGLYTALGFTLTPAIAFPALAYFNLIRIPLSSIPEQLGNLAAAEVSAKRLQDFIEQPEVQGIDELPPAGRGENAVVVENGFFAWEDDKKAVLKDIELKIKSGEFVVVVGDVGSGKSTLLQAFLGETIMVDGSVRICGDIAYTCQDPWIQNKTVKDNILWGRPYDEAQYQKTLEVCQLTEDMKILVAGDQTEIGEKGINLSGGQKHRVALARAVYEIADVYLLDDPLSAVDSHVGSSLVNKCICEHLKGTTRILVTHQVQFLPLADRIIIMAAGRVENFGTYQQLLDAGVDFKQVTISTSEDSSSDDMSPDSQAPGEDGKSPAKKGKPEASKPALMPAKTADGAKAAAGTETKAAPAKPKATQDSKSTGRLKLSLYTKYLGEWGPSFILPGLFFTMVMIERSFQLVQNSWLSVWANAALGILFLGRTFNNVFFFTVFVIIGVISVVAALVKTFVTVIGSRKASKTLHDRFVDRVLQLPMSFHDTQPASRLMNRFTKDVQGMDSLLVVCIMGVSIFFASAVASVVTIIAVSPWVILAMPPIGSLYVFLQNVYQNAAVELKRLESNSFSPIFGHFGETLSGLATIRAFRKSGKFSAYSVYLLNVSNRAMWPLNVANRWLSSRLQGLNVLLAYVVSLLVAVLFPVPAGFAGLAITSAISLNGIMNYLIRGISDLEQQMNAVERLTEYEDEETEAPAIISDSRPPPSWPTQGVIDVHELHLRYRPDLDPVLNGLTFRTRQFEKIGIAGRTGCGKSTLMMALYRIVEPTRGSITIDGVDVCRIGLRDLRSNLALVPQDPIMFSGTIRSNLDPFGEASDDALWQALRQVSMLGTVKELGGSKGLDAAVKEGGSNFSVGERQLLGLARAILRNTRILFLDEATSNTDNTTDDMVQTTIKTVFANCTVLTIAHRLHTIMSSDRIMILDKGTVAEFDTPSNLLRDTEGMFFSLVDEASKQGTKDPTLSD